MMAQFKGMLHLLHKRMADISYPESKQEILEQIGDETVKVDAVPECTGDHRTDPAGDIFLCGRVLLCTAWRIKDRRIRKGCCHIFSETERK